MKNAAQVVAVCDKGELFLVGREMENVVIYKEASLVVDENGRIAAVGPALDIAERFPEHLFELVIDATGKSVVPGLVDGHTHPVWAGDRVHEFALKLSGATYMEIHAQGGGIHFTVEHTTRASEDELLASLRSRLHQSIRHGTTLLEAKSGYGLALETEMKMLRVLHQASQLTEVPGQELPEIVSTYLAAHAVPKGNSAEEAAEDIVKNQLPALQALQAKGEISPTNIDVFLEKGVFGREETRRILQAGVEAGLQINFHGDEINPMQSGELAGELKALAVSHLERVSEEGMKSMAIRPTFAVLLPTTAYILRLEPPPARALIEHQVPVALGSDFNPNAFCISMPLVMNMACVILKLSLNEALVASTINAAGSLNKSADHGSLEVGKWGNCVIIDAPRWEHLIYQMGEPPISAIIHRGRPISP